MTNQEQARLHSLIETLLSIQADAPSIASYSQGRTKAGISYRIGDVLNELIELSDYEPAEDPEPEPTE